MEMRRFLACLLVLTLWAGTLPAQAAQPQTAEELQTILTPEDKQALLSALYESDISSVREALELRLISCEELTAYYLERIETYNEPYNCFITLCDNALEVARQRDEQMAAGEGDGLLFGIPVVLKDNIQYAGYPTTNGRASRLETISRENAAVVDYLLAEGAVILGKTNMSTAAQNARVSRSNAAGETKNAYDPHLASGGSSGGSAVAVSLNFAMAGLGTDTNSSLRFPAALNGCVSLRSSKGLLSKEGLVMLNRLRDTPGAITRTVYDQAVMLDVISGGEHRYAENLNGDALNGVRIGVLKELARPRSGSRSDAAMNDEIQAAFDRALEELSACGAQVVEVSLPNLFSLSQATFAHDDASAIARFYSAYQKLLRENDLAAVVFPTYYHAPQWSGRDADGVSHNVNDQPFISNCYQLTPCIGIPEINVPIGTHSRGAGIGVEIAADKGQEQLLLDLAYSYTQSYDHRAVPSGAPDLYAQAHAGNLTELIRSYIERLEERKRQWPERARTVREKWDAPIKKDQFRRELSAWKPLQIKWEEPTAGASPWAWGAAILCMVSLEVCYLLRLKRRQRDLVGSAR